MSPFEHQRNKKSLLTRIADYFISTRCMVVCSMLVVVLGVVYVVETNAVSGKGYTMKELERTVRILQEDTQKIELSVAGLSASKQLRVQATRLGFQPQKTVQYIATAPAAVARR